MKHEQTIWEARGLIDRFCLREDLSTYDPYDIWKTGLGIKVKHLFNTRRWLAAGPALGMALFDLLLNNRARWGYRPQEYPIARGLAAQILLRQYEQYGEEKYLQGAKVHLDWLRAHACRGYAGMSWGIGFKWPAFGKVVYDANTPHATHTPYVLEAFDHYGDLTGDPMVSEVFRSAFRFYETDLHVLYEDDQMMATSYGPEADKLVNNAVSYTLYMYTLFLRYLPEHERLIRKKIKKLYNFVVAKQRPDGSWLYAPEDPRPFIDCFHSCIIVKNLLKAAQRVQLEGVDEVAERGYRYIIQNFHDASTGLYKRFALSNKLSLSKFDLYDNAEVLNLALMMDDQARARELEARLRRYFVVGKTVYSMIDRFGRRRNRNTLRWAVLPYLYALTGWRRYAAGRPLEKAAEQKDLLH